MLIGPLQLLLSVAVAVIVIYTWGWWKIFSKAGYSGVLSLLMLIPILNIVMFLWIAFGAWPSLGSADEKSL